MTDVPDEALLARYLMGSCSEGEQARIEEQFFAADEVFERLCAVEEELIGRRLRGQLTGEDCDRFDRAYAEPPRRDRVLFVRALTTLLSEEAAAAAPVPPVTRQVAARTSWWTALWTQPGFRLAWTVAAVVLVAGIAVLSSRANRLQSSLASVQAQNEALRQQREADRARVAELEDGAAAIRDELNRERASRPPIGSARPSPGLVATFVLSPGLLRGAPAPARLRVRASVEAVRLELALEPGIDAARFRVELRDAGSRVVWSQDVRRATRGDAAAAVSIDIPAALLNDGEYEVVLLGQAGGRPFEEASRYYFDVVKK